MPCTSAESVITNGPASDNSEQSLAWQNDFLGDEEVMSWWTLGQFSTANEFSRS